ncbi:MAG: hypothetical protein ACLTW9_26630 [Enterocloster sp.]
MRSWPWIRTRYRFWRTELTTDADRELMDVNHADVTYKVVYRKNSVRASESNAIKMGGELRYGP